MKRVIVTGANGFIGKALCRSLLRQNIEVFAIVRDKSTMNEFLESNKLHVIEMEMSRYQDSIGKFPEDIDVFYHLAWIGTSGLSLSDVELQSKNLKFCCEALHVAEAIQSKKFIFAGTINELECNNLMNAQVYMPRSACTYGIMKLSCDYILKTQSVNMNITYNTAIVGSCFGPGDYTKRIHNTLISNLLRGTCPRLIEGNSMHDWIYVDDVADMFVKIGQTSIPLKNYYLGHRYLKRFDEILLEVRDIVNRDVPLEFGTLKQNFNIGYDQLNIQSVYEDTDYSCESNFAEQIKSTAEWVKSLQDRQLI